MRMARHATSRRALPLALLAACVTLGAAYAWKQARAPEACDFCQRAMCAGTEYTVHRSFGRAKHACCPRCGALYEKQHPGSMHATTVRDFATGREIHAEDAVFVEGSDFSHCSIGRIAHDQDGASYTVCYDRCAPSVVAFRDRRSAEGFETQHGGQLISFEELLQE
jgi:hypothetical protein